ncbi:PUA domain containing protein [Ferroglobus placidus DSM 10642]|uniref:PUA domain containing protein n=1 Tax=Ferroglobus placidus (strain DSM 10642 / AEDII12DO) TaxID=589924 RepID=D3RZS1_FERPA|nr:DUF1947 domain-containing protein [Ferroglobus placidus]ADC65984.1 PUA domain containing protein [Ferroglobus placidus DSM 10642]
MKRKMLRKKEAKKVLEEIKLRAGVELEGNVEVVEFGKTNAILINGEFLAIEHDGKYYLSVLGVMKFKPERGRVVVDSGATNFIINGADVMKPGIVEADKEIKEGDFCYVVVEEKYTPLAVGIALCSGAEMLGERGKAVKNVHHINDKLWKELVVKM